MEEQIQFTQEEVTQLSELRRDVSDVFTQLGQLSIERKRRMDELDSIESQLLSKHQELQKVEQDLFQSLNKKYGDGNYDPSTNVFTPSSNENGE